MKMSFTLAGLVLSAALLGCSTTQSASTSPGAVSSDGSKCCSGESKAACTDKKTDAAPGAVSEGGGCCHSKKADQASPGAVSESGGSGCCKGKTGGSGG